MSIPIRLESCSYFVSPEKQTKQTTPRSDLIPPHPFLLWGVEKRGRDPSVENQRLRTMPLVAPLPFLIETPFRPHILSSAAPYKRGDDRQESSAMTSSESPIAGCKTTIPATQTGCERREEKWEAERVHPRGMGLKRATRRCSKDSKKEKQQQHPTSRREEVR